MKQKHILLGLLALLGASCSNQDIEENLAHESGVQVTAGLTESRVSFNEGENTTYAYWQNGDAITLNTPKQGNLVYTASVAEKDATKATFSPQAGILKDIDGETVYAVYPATEIADGSVALPATEYWSDAQILPFAYAVSSIRNSKVDLQFKHVFSFLKLILKSEVLMKSTSTDGNKAIHKILIQSSSDSLSIQSGTFCFNEQNISIDKTSNKVSVSLDVAFQPENENERSVYIPILPQSTGIAMNIYALHEHASGCDTLLAVNKQTPSQGFVNGNVYTLELRGNSSAIIEGTNGEIHLAEPSLLSNYITNENKYNITKLKISGYLNGTDIRLLREMAGRDYNGKETNGKLMYLDVSEATIIEGGMSYYSGFKTQNYIWGKYFFERTNIKSISLPNNCTRIEERAFYGCKQLKEVQIPKGVISIDKDVFNGCSNLLTISFHKDALLKTIEEYAFLGCTSLTNLVIPDSTTTIGYRAFSGCTLLTKVALGKELESIGKEAFYNCRNLATVTMENKVIDIGSYAFYGCSALSNIELSSSLKSLGSSAFEYCTALQKINIPDSIYNILGKTFRNCSALKSIVIPENVTYIGVNAFSGCESLKSITIPNSVTTIGGSAFYGCSSLEEVIISENVTSIASSTFADCSSLKSIIIPQNVNSIDSYTFLRCKSLNNVTFNEQLVDLGEGAFYDCTSLKEVVLPKSIESVGSYAFNGCTSLYSISNIIVDNSHVLDGCSSLRNVTINNKTTKVGAYAFYNCNSLPTIVFPDKIIEIASCAFTACTSLDNILIPDGVVSIGIYAFTSCSTLTNIKLPESLTILKQETLRHCKSLKEIVIPNNVTAIERDVFSGCEKLTKVTIGESVTKIADGNFYYCPIAEFICYPKEPASFGSKAFSTQKMDPNTAKLYVPKGSLAAYQASDWATYFKNIIEM